MSARMEKIGKAMVVQLGGVTRVYRVAGEECSAFWLRPDGAIGLDLRNDDRIVWFAPKGARMVRIGDQRRAIRPHPGRDRCWPGRGRGRGREAEAVVVRTALGPFRVRATFFIARRTKRSILQVLGHSSRQQRQKQDRQEVPDPRDPLRATGSISASSSSNPTKAGRQSGRRRSRERTWTTPAEGGVCAQSFDDTNKHHANTTATRPDSPALEVVLRHRRFRSARGQRPGQQVGHPGRPDGFGTATHRLPLRGHLRAGREPNVLGHLAGAARPAAAPETAVARTLGRNRRLSAGARPAVTQAGESRFAIQWFGGQPAHEPGDDRARRRQRRGARPAGRGAGQTPGRSRVLPPTGAR